MLNIYDDFTIMGAHVKIGNSAIIGACVKIGNSAIIGDFARIGDYVEIGDSARIGDYVEIGDSARIGKRAVIGESARVGKRAVIGDYAEIGDGAEIGDYAEIGDGVKIGDKFRCEGLKVIDFFTMANVDGTGRRIHVYVHTEGITIRAGCFKGTLNEFCMKAEDEGKTLYARTVRAAAEAFADELRQQGKTGGW